MREPGLHFKEKRSFHRPDPTKERIHKTRILAEISRVCREFADEGSFLEVPGPYLSSKWIGACENLDTVFSVHYAGHRAYLRQTGQLYLEIYLPYEDKVWCIGPSFRAEEPDSRHLPQFTLFEIEFVGDFQDLLMSIEDLISRILSRVVQQRNEDLAHLGVDIERLRSIRNPFARITYDQAIEILGLEWGVDLKGIHEKALMKRVGGQPFFITHFPERIKFYNMRRNPENPSVVNSADLILPLSGETVGAAEREFEHGLVLEKFMHSNMYKRVRSKGGGRRDFSLYFDHLEQHGSVLHAGCGIGLERVLQFILGSNDIRDATPFGFARNL